MDLTGFAISINIPLVSAFFLGLAAAIGPCTMATNIAALAYVSRRVTDRKYAVATAGLYTVGRMFSYTLIGVLIIALGMEIPGMSRFLQDIGEKILGPFLIIIGVVLLFIDRISLGQGGSRISDMGGKVADWGMIGGFLLGALFALAFCPVSGVLFFAVLIPLALATTGGVTLPAFFAIGTGLPVLIFGILLSFGITGVTSWVNALTRADKVIRMVMAVVFIAVGLYYIVQWLK
ncbi:MAG: sulfite exporter TauE/SafE family protein [Chloroflexi bacterium]|nr:sulfite exporter TauE/SafE family protein [Chloroflexota bacterium]MBM4454030.1 sulfite exporter TauE/SafE family protein [Chloroflexota bacterium]